MQAVAVEIFEIHSSSFQMNGCFQVIFEQILGTQLIEFLNV